jgi:hypothetical protein
MFVKLKWSNIENPYDISVSIMSASTRDFDVPGIGWVENI